MTQTSSAQVKVKGITQVGIVVKDLQKTMESYWNILGIGPWSVYKWEAPLVYNRKYHGKSAWGREKIAETMVGSIQLELCQPIEGDSVYQDFLTEHGEGLHHVQFPVDDVDKTAEVLAKEGFPSTQSGHVGPTEYNCAYSYIDIKPLHAIWELVHEPEGMSLEHKRYPSPAQKSPAKVKVKSITQVGIVVKDLQKAMESYWKILGIGPWSITNWEAPLVHNRKYHGKSAWGREKIAETMVGSIQLELCQPIEGDSVYQDFLTEHGEGLHHVQFPVDDVDKTAEVLAKEGFPSIQSGHFGPAEYNYAYGYIDIEPLHTIWEPVHEGENIGAQPSIYP